MHAGLCLDGVCSPCKRAERIALLPTTFLPGVPKGKKKKCEERHALLCAFSWRFTLSSACQIRNRSNKLLWLTSISTQQLAVCEHYSGSAESNVAPHQNQNCWPQCTRAPRGANIYGLSRDWVMVVWLHAIKDSL